MIFYKMFLLIQKKVLPLRQIYITTEYLCDTTRVIQSFSIAVIQYCTLCLLPRNSPTVSLIFP